MKNLIIDKKLKFCRIDNLLLSAEAAKTDENFYRKTNWIWLLLPVNIAWQRESSPLPTRHSRFTRSGLYAFRRLNYIPRSRYIWLIHTIESRFPGYSEHLGQGAIWEQVLFNVRTILATGRKSLFNFVKNIRILVKNCNFLCIAIFTENTALYSTILRFQF